MSDVLLDFMEADTQSGASNVEKVTDGGLQSVADLARAVRDKELSNEDRIFSFISFVAF